MTSPTHSLLTSESVDIAAKRQVQETWLTILGNFTKAVDLGMETFEHIIWYMIMIFVSL